jgi:hypothetical protein
MRRVVDPAMSTLSSILVQRQLAPMRAIEAAIARQVLQGGDLATSLLELGTLDESALIPLLAEITGLRPAPVGRLDLRDARALRAVPGELAIKHGFFPLDLQGRTLKIAVAEPLDAVLGEDLCFMLDVELDPCVAPLARIRQAIAEHLGIPLDRRFLRLAAKLDGQPDPSPSLMPPPLRGPGPFQLPRPVHVPPPTFGAGVLSTRSGGEGSPASPAVIARTPVVAAPAEQPPAVSIPVNPVPAWLRTDEAGSEPPKDHQTQRRAAHRGLRELIPEHRAGASRERHKGPFSRAAAERELDEATSHHALIETYFDFAAQFFEYAALFTVRADLAEGRDARGPGADRERVLRVGVPLDLPSSLATARANAAPTTKRFASEGLDAELLHDLERTPRAGEADVARAVVPLVMRERVVALLYGDDGRADVALSALGELVSFTALVGARAERLLLKKKQARARPSARPTSGVVRPAEEASASASPRGEREDSAEIAISPSAASEPWPRSDAALFVMPSAPPPAPEAPAVAAPAVDDEGIPSVIVRAAESEPPAVDDPARPPSDVARGPARPPKRKQTVPGMPAFVPPTAATTSGSPEARTSESPIPPAVDGLPSVQSVPRRGLAPEFAARPARAAMGEPLPLTPPPNATSSDPSTGQAFPLVTSRRRQTPASRDDSVAVSSDAASIEPASTASMEAARVLPLVVVDVEAEYARLVTTFIEGGPASDHAFAELIRHAEIVVPMIAPEFPGKLRIDRHRGRDDLPAASQCGPLLELFVAARRVALAIVVAESASPDLERRFWATHVLGELRYDEAASALVPRLFDDDAAVRRIARRSAAALVASDAAQPILTGLDALIRGADHSVEQRVLALETVGDIRLSAMVPMLVAILDDPCQEVVEAAGKALLVITRQDHAGDGAAWNEWWARRGSHHRIEWLIDALVHDTPAIRRAAGDELKSITKEYFGYYDDLPKRERERAQVRYREWWRADGHRRFS